MYLIGTPSIGNLDDDAELEVVFSGYSSDNKIFAINADGSNVDGFPLDLGEKTKAGPALADFNSNGIDDIVIGTDDDHIYLILDDGTIAPGFPFVTGDKNQAAPSILEINGENYIITGSNDNNLYVINSDGSLYFSVTAEDKIQTSPSFLEVNGNVYIFFGSKDDKIYGVDLNGNNLPGWPISLNGDIISSIIFSDFDGNGDSEITAFSDTGEMRVFHLDGSSYHHFPILNNYPFKGSPMIIDFDSDGDLEIFGGSAGNLAGIDIKETGSNENYWNIFRGNNQRNGLYVVNSVECGAVLGDVTGDGEINILDLVQISNLILEFSVPEYECAADFNQDGEVNILDLVQVANYILEN